MFSCDHGINIIILRLMVNGLSTMESFLCLEGKSHPRLFYAVCLNLKLNQRRLKKLIYNIYRARACTEKKGAQMNKQKYIQII